MDGADVHKDTRTFRVNNRWDAILGGVLFVLATAYVLTGLLTPWMEGEISILVAAGLFAGAGGLLFSHVAVKEIAFCPEAITFQPLGVKIPRDAIVDVQMDYKAAFEERGELTRLRLTFTGRSFVWIPLNFLRVGEHASWRVVGVVDPVGFMAQFGMDGERQA